MYMTPEEKDFTFKKIKMKDGVVEIHADAKFSENDEVHTQSINGDKFTFVPHEDLTSQLEMLKEPLAKLYGLLNAETLIISPEFKATPAQKKAAELATASALMDVKVTGVNVSGEGQNRGCTITGIYDGQGISSKLIRFIGEGLGFEDKIQEAAEKIVDETYKYLYENKRGEAEILKDANQTEMAGTENGSAA